MPVPLPFSPYFYILFLFAKWQWELRKENHAAIFNEYLLIDIYSFTKRIPSLLNRIFYVYHVRPDHNGQVLLYLFLLFGTVKTNFLNEK